MSHTHNISCDFSQGVFGEKRMVFFAEFSEHLEPLFKKRMLESEEEQNKRVAGANETLNKILSSDSGIVFHKEAAKLAIIDSLKGSHTALRSVHTFNVDGDEGLSKKEFVKYTDYVESELKKMLNQKTEEKPDEANLDTLSDPLLKEISENAQYTDAQKAELKEFITKAKQNDLKGRLDKYNARSFDTDDLRGIHKDEGEKWASALKKGIEQIVKLGNTKKLEEVHNDLARRDRMIMDSDKGASESLDMQETILGEGESSLGSDFLKKNGNFTDAELRAMEKVNFGEEGFWKALGVLFSKRIRKWGLRYASIYRKCSSGCSDITSISCVSIYPLRKRIF